MIAGRYSLDREIGRGGMGAVWLGRDEVLGRPVALKRIGLLPGASSPDMDRAEREARLAARLNHPNVVAVFDLVDEDDLLWLVMEYVAGSTLAGLVREQGPLSPDRAAAIVGQAADGLAAAHAAGIVHRDVKPSNILVTPSGAVKLTDFGIARAEADPSLTQTGLVTGSPAYLAPEVASGRTATDASDVWSLGATLFHALAGSPPYEVGDNLLGALYRIVHEDPPRLPDAGWLAPVLEATMTRAPEDRWSMAQVRDALRAGPGSAAGPTSGVRAAPSAPSTSQDSTQVIARPVALPPPPGAPPATPQSAPRRSRTPLLAVLLGVAAIVLLTAAAFKLGQGDDATTQPEASPSGTETPRRTPSESATRTATADRPTPEGMSRFVVQYLRTAAADPDAGFELLTPAYQQASGGLDGYTDFWGRVEGVSDIEVLGTDVAARTVTYQYTYRLSSGRAVTETVVLRLAYDDGTYLIETDV